MRSKATPRKVPRADARQREPPHGETVRRQWADISQYPPAQQTPCQSKEMPRKRKAENSTCEASQPNAQVTSISPHTCQVCLHATAQQKLQYISAGKEIFSREEWPCIIHHDGRLVPHRSNCTPAHSEAWRPMLPVPAGGAGAASLLVACQAALSCAPACCSRTLQQPCAGGLGRRARGQRHMRHGHSSSSCAAIPHSRSYQDTKALRTFLLSGTGVVQDAAKRSVDAQQRQIGPWSCTHDTLDIDFAHYDAAEVARRWHLLCGGTTGAALPTCLPLHIAGSHVNLCVLHPADALQCLAYSWRGSTGIWQTTQS